MYSQEQCERHYLLPQRIWFSASYTQSQRNSELEELRARVSTLTKKLNLKKAAAKTDVEEVSQPDNIILTYKRFLKQM